MNNKYNIRKAALVDIPALTKHHRLMFEEIRALQSGNIKISKFDAMEKSYLEKLTNEFCSDIFDAWVIENDNIIIASGAITICSLAPTPEAPTFLSAYIHSMYTEKPYRKQGLAVQIIEEMKKHCRQKEIFRIFLAASDAGRPVYKSIGFLNRLIHSCFTTIANEIYGERIFAPRNYNVRFLIEFSSGNRSQGTVCPIVLSVLLALSVL